jgi:hypothetical protein
MLSQHDKSSDYDGGHDCQDHNRPGSEGHRFMVTALLGLTGRGEVLAEGRQGNRWAARTTTR